MGYLNYLKVVNKDNFNITDIIERIEKIAGQYTFQKLIEDLVNCDVVLIYNSFAMKIVTFLARAYQEEIFVSNYKYLPDHSTFFVGKDLNFTDIIKI